MKESLLGRSGEVRVCPRAFLVKHECEYCHVLSSCFFFPSIAAVFTKKKTGRKLQTAEISIQVNINVQTIKQKLDFSAGVQKN